MSTNIFIILPDNRRKVYSVTPSMSLRNVIDIACKDAKINDPENYILKNNNVVMDLTTTIRFLGIPSGIKLNLIKSKNAKSNQSASKVVIALQTEEGGRLRGEFSSTTTLWELLEHFEKRSNGRMNITRRTEKESPKGNSLMKMIKTEKIVYVQPVCIIMNKEYGTINDLKRTTLKDAGITGNSMIRLLNRLTNNTIEEMLPLIESSISNEKQLPDISKIMNEKPLPNISKINNEKPISNVSNTSNENISSPILNNEKSSSTEPSFLNNEKNDLLKKKVKLESNINEKEISANEKQESNESNEKIQMEINNSSEQNKSTEEIESINKNVQIEKEIINDKSEKIMNKSNELDIINVNNEIIQKNEENSETNLINEIDTNSNEKKEMEIEIDNKIYSNSEEKKEMEIDNKIYSNSEEKKEMEIDNKMNTNSNEKKEMEIDNKMENEIENKMDIDKEEEKSIKIKTNEEKEKTIQVEDTQKSHDIESTESNEIIDRNMKFYNPPKNGNSMPNNFELPSSFFELSSSELKLLINQQKMKIDKQNNQQLMTKAMREQEDELKRKKYPKCRIRVKFPNQLMIEMTFLSNEPISELYNQVKSVLYSKEKPFYLYTTPPKSILENNDLSFWKAGLVPSSNVYFNWENEKDKVLDKKYLSQEYQNKLCDFIKENPNQKIENNSSENARDKGKSPFGSNHGIRLGSSSSNNKSGIFNSKSSTPTKNTKKTLSKIPTWFKLGNK